MHDVDLTQLQVDRGGSAATRPRAGHHLLTRYVLPGALLTGFAALMAWAFLAMSLFLRGR